MNNANIFNERELPFIDASLTFLLKTGEKPINFPSIAGGEDERNIGESTTHRVAIRNARRSNAKFSVDCEGFTLVNHKTRVRNFYDDKQVSKMHEREVGDLLTELTQADRVVVFDHTRRTDDADLRRSLKTRDPSGTIHNDYTEQSATQRVRDIFGADAERYLDRRFAIINTWRSAAGPVYRSPIALCDAQTLDCADLIATERRARDRIGETYRVAFSARQEWYYYPQMQPDEVLIIKTYDSANDGRAKFTPHGAFENPAAAPDAPARQSIESRAFVFF